MAFRLIVEPLPVETVLSAAAEALGVELGEFRQRRRNSSLRAVAASLLCRYAGLTQRAVADRLDMGTGAAVSRQLRSLPERLSADRGLRRKMQQVEKGMRQRLSRNE